jgi:oxygen-independent coproporphyrinogen-3 oxidase
VLTAGERYAERLLLGVRLAEGLPLADLTPAAREQVAALVADGLADPAAALRGGPPDGDARRLVLTRRGRLLADGVVRRLLG